MAAAVAVADATLAPPVTQAVMSDADMAAWNAALPEWTRAAGLDPGSLRAGCPEGRFGLWHFAGARGRTNVCEYLKSKGLLDLIDQATNGGGMTPLHIALSGGNEGTARWMVDNGADTNAVTNYNYSVFCIACWTVSPSFVEELAGKVAPEHLTMCNNDGVSPIRTALFFNPDPLAVVRMLILRGVPARPEDFPASEHPIGDLLPRRRELLASLEADLHLNDSTFLGLFLAGGVHAPDTTPACTTTTTTATTKRVRTQRPDGSWSDPVTVPCEPHLVVTAAPTIRRSGRVAARVGENHLPKLRGYRNSEVRMEIAAFLGVREAPDLARLRAARDVVAALPEYQRW